ncbi:MAG: TIR domain-containing protein [Nostoc sp. NMS7]|uniref:TIR domain-containing protein n=1 Tax=Nostoc sp. NMS7 TaxID=2815391 RepID=UPI0025E1CE54|nr:TIR domain-containing protein [Nostoc sp. NMS7]MBN3951225.1 TIR domain-containing protein [Nostoc sp. NMS7]
MATVFFSYSHRDETLRDELEVHLTMLKRQGFIETWHDRRITAGEEFDKSISKNLEEADIILLLVSSDFLASNYCYGIEMQRAMEKHEQRESHIIPVILRSCDWRSAPFGKLLVTPTDGKPITKFPNQDDAFLEVVNAPSGNTESTLQYFNDASNIASYARSPIAAATQKQIVVNYPNVKFLNPTATARRAQVAAFIYQALVSSNQVSAINSPYVVAAVGSTTPTDGSVTIPQGTAIAVKYDKAEKILVTKDETAPLTLTVSQNVVTQDGTIVIPAGSQIIGQLKPATGGSQFAAQKLVLASGQEYQLNATSEVITKTETVKKGISTSAIIKDTVLGAGAATAISAVTGDRAIATEEILGGAGIGALVGLLLGKNSVDLIAIDPNTDLQMTINQNLLVSLR